MSIIFFRKLYNFLKKQRKSINLEEYNVKYICHFVKLVQKWRVFFLALFRCFFEQQSWQHLQKYSMERPC